MLPIGAMVYEWVMGCDGLMMLMKFEVCVRDLAGRLAGRPRAGVVLDPSRVTHEHLRRPHKQGPHKNREPNFQLQDIINNNQQPREAKELRTLESKEAIQ